MFNYCKTAWKCWVRFAEILGNIQMVVLLTIIYWTMMLIIAVPFKLFADPLCLKKGKAVDWITKDDVTNDLESMRRQG
mgnify:CR=1 FL=1